MIEILFLVFFVVDLEVQVGQIGIFMLGMEIKLVFNGDKIEICYCGFNVILGYWCVLEQMVEVFDEEGYFCLGDVVCWLDLVYLDCGFMFDGCVVEDFKFYIGIWVSVGLLCVLIVYEGVFYLQDVVIIGQDCNEVGMLIVFNIECCCQLVCLFVEVLWVDVFNVVLVCDFFQGLLECL